MVKKNKLPLEKINMNNNDHDDINNTIMNSCMMNDFVQSCTALIELENEIKQCLESKLVKTTDKKTIKKIKDNLDNINKSRQDDKIVVTNPLLFDQIKKLNIDDIKHMNGDNIIKFPGLTIIN